MGLIARVYPPFFNTSVFHENKNTVHFMKDSSGRIYFSEFTPPSTDFNRSTTTEVFMLYEDFKTLPQSTCLHPLRAHVAADLLSHHRHISQSTDVSWCLKNSAHFINNYHELNSFFTNQSNHNRINDNPNHLSPVAFDLWSTLFHYPTIPP